MFNYKAEKINLGTSDIASVIVYSPGTLRELYFGEDGCYSAYITHNAKDSIPSHYTLKFTADGPWLKVYDDNEATVNLTGKRFNIFRAGEFGCVIDIED